MCQHKNVASHLSAALFVVCLVCSCQGERKNDLFEDMRLVDLTGQSARLSCPASRLLVLNLWATWCAPCKKELAHLGELHEEFRQVGCDVVGISLDSIQPEKLQAEVAARGIAYPVFRGDAGRVLAVLGVPAVPATVIVNDRGVILKRLTGYHTKEELRSAVFEAVQAPASSGPAG